MSKAKLFRGGIIGVRVPEEINERLRTAALATGKSLSELVRETLAFKWGSGQQPPEVRAA